VGADVARLLAAAGASVLVAARTSSEVDSVATELRATGADVSATTCDVSDPLAIERLTARARDTFGRVDILVNNAGMATAATLARTTLDEWNRLLAINATGAFLCTQAFLPGMLERRWGRVVNVASTAALTGYRYIAAYAASKHALLGLTRSVAAEAAGHGVTVNAVCPSYLATRMTEETLDRVAARTGRSREEALQAITGQNPQKRLIEPHEVAAAVVYLCSDAAAGVNGSALVIDGGELRR
jgi:NAD(P)-dependent dehydrogenase (short-subunit alcohol dehydrogenase family)